MTNENNGSKLKTNSKHNLKCRITLFIEDSCETRSDPLSFNISLRRRDLIR